MSRNLQNYTKALYALDAVVQRVPEAAWDNQSPCEQWSARQVLGHVIWHTERIANACEGSGPPAEQAEADVAGANPVATWNASRDRVFAALDQQGALQQQTEVMGAQQPLDFALSLQTLDAMTHAWDIGQAAGVPAVVPQDLAASSLAMLAQAGDVIRTPGIFGAAVEISEDADVVSRFLAFSGRTPS